MPIKLSQLIKINSAIVDLINKDRENKLLLSSALRLRLRDNIVQMRSAMDEYQKENNALVEKYGTLIPDGSGMKQIKQDAEGWEEFKTQFEAMLNEEYDVTIKPITEAEILGSETKEYRVDVGMLINLNDLGVVVAEAPASVQKPKKSK